MPRAMWLAPVNLSRRIAEASGPPKRHGATMRSSGSGSRMQRAQISGCSAVGSAQRGHAGPSSTSDVAHDSQIGPPGAVHATH